MRTSLPLTLFIIGGLLCGHAAPAKAQSFGNSQLKMLSPEHEAEASRLRAAEAQQYDFSKATLADVLRFLATDAGISFFSLPDDSPVGARLITFSIKASAFQVLETLCKANELSLIPDNGIWYIRPADDKELLGKSYTILNNALEMVEKVESRIVLFGFRFRIQCRNAEPGPSRCAGDILDASERDHQRHPRHS